MGNITSIKKAQRTESGTNETTYQNSKNYVSYQYDKLGQLTEENFSGGRKTQWTYDELGNITSKVVTKNGTTKTIAYEYGKDGKTGWNYLLTGFDDKTITYDQIGNPTAYLGATLTWSGRQLDSYTKGTNAITYTYNSDGLRASKTVNGVKSDYYYVNGRLHYEKRSDGSSLRFFYDSYGYLTVIEHKTTAAGIKSYYVATNLRGDVVALYKGDGTCIAKYEYDAWGNMLSVKDASNNDITDAANIANINPIRYRGYYYDAETNLYYLQSRYYNAEVGRFLNADGYISTGQGVLSYNMFAYCGNNPVMYSDPSGCFLQIVAAIVIVGLAVVGGILGACADEPLIKKSQDATEKKHKEDSPIKNDFSNIIVPKDSSYKDNSPSNRDEQNNIHEQQELSLGDKATNIFIGSTLGLAVGGVTVTLGAMALLPVIGTTASANLFALGVLTFNAEAIIFAPFYSVELDPIEWE